LWPRHQMTYSDMAQAAPEIAVLENPSIVVAKPT
jgi:hypothetical protein